MLNFIQQNLWLPLGVVTFIIVYAGTMFFSKYTIVRVTGTSMMPTFKDGKIVVCDRRYYNSLESRMEMCRWSKEHHGKIIVIRDPDGKPVIKRIKYIAITLEAMYIWVEGDNKEPGGSIDSRDYGFLNAANIIGEVFTWTQLIKSKSRKPRMDA